VIGCPCAICRSGDPRDKRLRTSALVQVQGMNIAIDCGPDFRQQILRTEIDHLDAILLTHEHNDHVIGLDEVRPFNFMSRKDMPVYGTSRVLHELKGRFPYVFDEVNRYPGAPMVLQRTIRNGQVFSIGALDILPLEVMHGMMPVTAYRFGSFAYITDMRTISDESFERLRWVDTVVVNALHFSPYYSHMNVEEALAFIARLGPKQAYLTHASHKMGLHEMVNKTLPPGVELGYDGMKIKILER